MRFFNLLVFLSNFLTLSHATNSLYESNGEAFKVMCTRIDNLIGKDGFCEYSGLAENLKAESKSLSLLACEITFAFSKYPGYLEIQMIRYFLEDRRLTLISIISEKYPNIMSDLNKSLIPSNMYGFTDQMDMLCDGFTQMSDLS